MEDRRDAFTMKIHSRFAIYHRRTDDSRARIEGAFVEDELNSMNRAIGSRMLLVVHRGRARKHAVQKAPVTFSKHEVHWSAGNENTRPFLIVRVATSRRSRLARGGIDVHSLTAPNASAFSALLLNLMTTSIFTIETIRIILQYVANVSHRQL